MEIATAKITAQFVARHLRDVAESLDKISSQASHPWFMMAIAVEELIRENDKLKEQK